MNKLTEAYRTIGVFNAYDFAEHGNVYLCFYPEDRSRGGLSAGWKVHRPGFKTDPNGPWYEYGDKSFLLFGCGWTPTERRNGALKQAQEWAGKRYGITEWAKTPFGDWMDAGFVARRKKELAAMLKAKGVAA